MILSQINAFYLQKEAELRLRMETLLSKRRAAAAKGIPDATDTATHSEWSAVGEGFRLLEQDLGKLQVRQSSLGGKVTFVFKVTRSLLWK